MPTTLDPTSLRVLQGLQSASRVSGRTQPELDILSGDDVFAPDELTVRKLQLEDPTASMLSREEISQAGLQNFRNKFRIKKAEQESAARAAALPKQVEGEYRLKAAETEAKAAEERRRANEAAMERRQQTTQDAIAARQRETQQAIAERQQTRETTQGRTPVTARSKIASLRAAAEKAGAPSMLGKLGGYLGMDTGKNTQLESFDAAQGLAQAIVEDYPDYDVEDALMELGQDELTPEELAQVNQLVFLMRGR